MVAAANRADYKNRLLTPDALDMLITAKAHDLKPERMAAASDEDWLFALVTLQTYEGFLGAGNYGVSRMNGGFASRMSLGVRPAGGGAAASFRRDVTRLIADGGPRPDRRGGTPLLWTVPWDGTLSLKFSDLDELYVDICRRVRLRHAGESIEALAAGSKCARVAATELKGKTDDPWAPVKADGSSSHTPTGAGFGYRQIANLLNREKVVEPLLARLHPDDDREDLAIVAAALVRGQGKTEGLHRRTVRTSRVEEIEETGDVKVLDLIGDVAMRRTQEAGEAARILVQSLNQMLQGGPKTKDVRGDDNSTKAKVEPWRDTFDGEVDKRFFDEDFWAELADVHGDHRQKWRGWLAALTVKVFEEAFERGPRTEMRRLQAWARARSALDGRLKSWLGSVSDAVAE